MKLKILAIICFFAGSSAAAVKKPAPGNLVTFVTADGWTISAWYQPAQKNKPTVLMSHGVGSTAREWEQLEGALKPKGIGWLAIDMRGHGDSLKSPKGDKEFMYFGSKDWNSALNDLNAGLDYLKTKGVQGRDIYLAGASIGANLALKCAAQGAMVKGVVLLSPGLDYRGVKIDGLMPKLRTIPILAAAAPSDGYAWSSARSLEAEAKTSSVKFYFYPGESGHGVNMFKDAKQGGAFLKRVADWIK